MYKRFYVKLYQDICVVIDKETGYINLTNLLRQHDSPKPIRDITKITLLQDFMNDIINLYNIYPKYLITGNDTEFSGSYIHQYMIPKITNHLRPIFAHKLHRAVFDDQYHIQLNILLYLTSTRCEHIHKIFIKDVFLLILQQLIYLYQQDLTKHNSIQIYLKEIYL